MITIHTSYSSKTLASPSASISFSTTSTVNMNETYSRYQLLHGNFGFTLIEMAMVLAIIALIMGAILSFIRIQMTSQELKQTQSRQQIIQAALINYISRNNHLPCPADITVADDAPSAGLANCAASIATGGGVSVGAVPWIDLGLPVEGAKDAYGRRFTYIVTSATTNLTADASNLPSASGQFGISGLAGNISVWSAGSTTQLNACPSTLPCPNLGVVGIISHGTNGYGGYYSGGVIPLSVASSDEKTNAGHNNNIVVRDMSQDQYDDIVMWLKPDDLLNPLMQSGAIKGATGFNNTQFELAKIQVVSQTWSHSIWPGCGGTGGFVQPFSLTPNQNDAWGKKITFNWISPTSTICNSTSTNTPVFTLSSSGFDLTLGTNDDVLITVTAGEMFLIGSKLGLQ